MNVIRQPPLRIGTGVCNTSLTILTFSFHYTNSKTSMESAWKGCWNVSHHVSCTQRMSLLQRWKLKTLCSPWARTLLLPHYPIIFTRFWHRRLRHTYKPNTFIPRCLLTKDLLCCLHFKVVLTPPTLSGSRSLRTRTNEWKHILRECICELIGLTVLFRKRRRSVKLFFVSI